MGSDFDYINEHMGGHDEDGLPNFMSEPGFSDDYREYESEDNSRKGNGMKKKQAYFILENLIARIEIEEQSLNSLTDLELDSLKYALSRISPRKSKKQDTNEFDDDDIPF